jgi:DNA repair exonuclease SbcCD nuclease subunit
MAVLHGNIKGAIYGMNTPDLNSPKSPVFSIEHFARCNGPIICGHVHVAKCLMNHIYYCGSPLRWQFGEEQEKGFIICVYDPRNHGYYNHFEVIESFRYDTVDLDSMINAQPESVIQYIKTLKANGIDYVKVRFSSSSATTDIVKKYFSNYNNVIVDVTDTGFVDTIKENQKNNNQFAQYNYILDPHMSESEIFTRYVNEAKGEQFITVQELEKILSEI